MEYFAAKEAAATDGGFVVELARSGKTVQVRAGQTILDSLMAEGVEPPTPARKASAAPVKCA
jgi:vanillate O-demethylase ferredoxin subunit